MNNITEYLLSNREHLIELVSDLTAQKARLLSSLDPSMHKDVYEQFNSTVKLILMTEVSKAIAESAENVMLVLEAINLDTYLDDNTIEAEVL